MFKHRILAGLLVVGLVGTAQVSAAGLPPGATVTPPPAGSIPAGSTFLAGGTENYSFTVAGKTFKGTVQEAVYKDKVTGKLDFLYQFTSTNATGAQTFTMASFAGAVITEVSQAAKPTPVFATGTDKIASVSGDGSTITTTLTAPLTSNTPAFVEILKTTSSGFSTNGTLTADGNAAILAGKPGLFVPNAPLPTPEPTTLVLFGGAFLGMGLFGVRRRRKNSGTQTMA